eukprot:NODE_3514_length_394_cov_1.011594_g2967_i0.p1 GENE.NODE_3514_length_394_cov_1.011594_g2967_i0~~NODE_3514_length_394_cov_1.011594_g2967_i0.p1  ORF type:complete len:50 (-),score=5.85 NODE_3514_length_394_cov_1.011594_g2967_i0:146-295(-)
MLFFIYFMIDIIFNVILIVIIIKSNINISFFINIIILKCYYYSKYLVKF